MTDQEHEIVVDEMWERAAPRSLPAVLVGVLARSGQRVGQVALRRVSDIVALRRATAPETDVEARPLVPLPRPNAYLASFIAAVVVPSFLAFVYLAFIASDQYVAEARFAVQSAQFGFSGGDKKEGTNSAMSSLGAGSIPSLAGQDAYVITNYIHSRAILDDLAGTIDVKAIYQRPGADFWARLKKNPSAEELTDYWDGMVSTYIDGPSGIVTLQVKAFRPEDAQTLAKAIIAASEKLANDVSERTRDTIMQQAEAEVRRSEGLVTQALADMRNFRDQQGFIDPVAQATSTSKLLLAAMAQKITLENNYFVASKAMSADAPTVTELKSQLDGLDSQIDKLKGELTSTSPQGRTIAASLTTFEALELKRIFAEKLYTMSQDSLEAARLRAQNQNIFVSTFA
ncbi:MAG TPA: capsule biosynthesis protein, partial [Beijerinckiaceae bacterium]|nr:capsule biosynthesis protein [Beijerinckiaceae bacterium]